MFASVCAAVAFAGAPTAWRAPRHALSPRAPHPAAALQPLAATAKERLLDAIATFDAARARDGTVPVDFGVSGGELDADTRAPRDLVASGAFYRVSDAVGKAADAVVSAADALGEFNPTAEPTALFGTDAGARCPLHGSWHNIFTTAADATFSSDSRRGDARASNTVDAVRSRVTNIIEFAPPAFADLSDVGAARSPLQSLRVRLSAAAVSPTRVELVFRIVFARLNALRLPLTLVAAPPIALLCALLGAPTLPPSLPRIAARAAALAAALGGLAVGVPLPLFGRRLTLAFPVPGPTITRLLFAFSKCAAIHRLVVTARPRHDLGAPLGAALALCAPLSCDGMLAARRKEVPRAYFDVLYLDETLRVHRTGQGNLFIQQRAATAGGGS